jgi:hypothetical protein
MPCAPPGVHAPCIPSLACRQPGREPAHAHLGVGQGAHVQCGGHKGLGERGVQPGAAARRRHQLQARAASQGHLQHPGPPEAAGRHAVHGAAVQQGVAHHAGRVGAAGLRSAPRSILPLQARLVGGAGRRHGHGRRPAATSGAARPTPRPRTVPRAIGRHVCLRKIAGSPCELGWTRSGCSVQRCLVLVCRALRGAPGCGGRRCGPGPGPSLRSHLSPGCELPSVSSPRQSRIILKASRSRSLCPVAQTR